MKRDDITAYAVTTNTPAVRVQDPATAVGKMRAQSGCWLAAPAANGAPVYIGGSNVAVADGFELTPGSRHFFEIDPANLWVISAAAQSLRVLLV